jgi:hypothetical protein
VFARAALLVVALAAIVWAARDLDGVIAYRQARQLVYASHTLSPAEIAEARRLLRRASATTPDQAVAVDGVVLSYRTGRLRDAERRADSVVRSEPSDTAAWAWLLAATRSIDPARAQQARLMLARLDPKGRRPLGR